MITVAATLKDVSSANLPGATLTMELRGYGAQLPRSAAGVLAELEAEAVADGSGAVSLPVLQNDQIQPARTYYVAVVRNANGDAVQVNAYQFFGPDRTANLATELPIDPTNLQVDPLIEDLTVFVPWNGGNIVFDGLLGLVFYVYLTGDVQTVTFRNAVPGNNYTVILQQDGAGDHLFPFPANMHGAPADIGFNANATTTMIFASRRDGSLDNTGLGVISRTA